MCCAKRCYVLVGPTLRRARRSLVAVYDFSGVLGLSGGMRAAGIAAADSAE